jgi:serine/threonine-protein kinase
MNADWLKPHGLELVKVVKSPDLDGRALWQVKAVSLGLQYALKRLPAGDRQAEQVVRNELVALNRLPFALAPHCHRCWVETGHIHLLLDWVEGRPLDQLFQGEALEAGEAKRRLQVVLMLGEAMQRVHQEGLLHRDVKPANVVAMLPNQRDVKAVFLVDFGLATQRRQYEEGTVGFAAPEQFANRTLRLGAATDVLGLS